MRVENKAWWYLILQALAGIHPSRLTTTDADRAYTEREAMKTAALEGLTALENRPGLERANWWLLWAYSHWWRVCEQLDAMDPIDREQAFPDEAVGFREYLCAWLWSVGVPDLNMTADDIKAVHVLTGCAPMPHPLLPRGYSQFVGCFETTKITQLPAKDLTLENVLQAFEASGS